MTCQCSCNDADSYNDSRNAPLDHACPKDITILAKAKIWNGRVAGANRWIPAQTPRFGEECNRNGRAQACAGHDWRLCPTNSRILLDSARGGSIAAFGATPRELGKISLGRTEPCAALWHTMRPHREAVSLKMERNGWTLIAPVRHELRQTPETKTGGLAVLPVKSKVC